MIATPFTRAFSVWTRMEKRTLRPAVTGIGQRFAPPLVDMRVLLAPVVVDGSVYSCMRPGTPAAVTIARVAFVPAVPT